MSDNKKILPGDQTHDVEGTRLRGVRGRLEGHVRMTVTNDDEDVEGHVQPRRDIDIER